MTQEPLEARVSEESQPQISMPLRTVSNVNTREVIVCGKIIDGRPQHSGVALDKHGTHGLYCFDSRRDLCKYCVQVDQIFYCSYLSEKANEQK